jgi:dTDP-4-amino-4,6-dideoxygalactose transaminase
MHPSADSAWATDYHLRLLRPDLPPAEKIERYFELSRAARYYANGGPCHELLVERARGRLGGRLVVPVANGSMGLLAALRALVPETRGRRREVLVPSFTFPAAPAVIKWCGLTPVFCDVDADGWHLSAEGLADALAARGQRVVAIVAGVTFGTPPPEAQVSAWRALADAAGIPLVVDSAPGFGAAEVRDADAEVFSLHATKPMPIGEGGLIAVRDPEVARRVRMLINHGFDENGVVALPGLNGKLDEWHAAAALAGLDRVENAIATRQAHARAIGEALRGRGITFQAGAARSATQFVPALMPSERARDASRQSAETAGVEFRAYFNPPLHRTPAYSSCDRAGDLGMTESVSARILSLPMASDQTAAEREQIVGCVIT